MIDEKTPNKNYPLPHSENIASQDVERIATSISMIDADMQACSDAANSIVDTVKELDKNSLRIPTESIGKIDPKLKNLAPRQYIVVNDDASGFSTVEGGGGEGGKKGEILVKRSDANFDTTWLDPRAILKRASITYEATGDCCLVNNIAIILADICEIDNSAQMPRLNFTLRQAAENTIGEESKSYVFCDEIDDTAEADPDIASETNFGRVKIGAGVNVDNGTISVPTIGVASKDEFGLVKIGDGLEITDGVLTAQTYPHADHENFGIIKPSADFNFDSNGALQLANKSEDIIYQTATKNIVEDGVIKIVPTCAYYRAFINTDTLFSFDFGDFAPKADIAFDLEIIADGEYVVNFGSNVVWDLPCVGVFFGTTIIHFEKLFGEHNFYGTLKQAAKATVRLLTPDTSADITDNYICGHNGSGWQACDCMVVRDYSNYTNFSNPTDGIWRIDFMKSTYVQYLQYVQGFDNWTATYFYIEGSVDRKNWKRLLPRENVKPTTYTLDEHGFFKHYRIRCKNTQIRYFRWYGFDVEDDRYELQRIMPIMSANSMSGFAITSSGLASGNLYNLTTDSINSWANFETRLNDEFWVKYELAEPQSVDMIDLGARYGAESDRMPTWFKIEGSNDDENWGTVFERAFLTRWYQGESRQYWIYNKTPYKFYRLTSLEQPTANFSLSRFRLYKKIDGTPPRGFVPILSSDSQGGFEVKASSNDGSNHWPYLAFDGTTSTKWATTNHWGAGDWIQVKFPAPDICNYLRIGGTFSNEEPESFVLSASNNGENYVELLNSGPLSWNHDETKTWNLENETAYKFYKVEAVNTKSAYITISEI